MIEVSSIFAGFSAAERVLGAVKAVSDANYNLKTAELKDQMAEIKDANADMKNALNDARQKISELESEIARITAAKERKMREKNQMYVEVDDEGNDIDGVFCSRCYDQEFRVVRVSRPTGAGWGRCPQCDARYDMFSQTYHDLKSSIKDRQSAS